METPLSFWIAFHVGVLIVISIDLFMFRKAHAVALREALIWSVVWVVLSLGFNGLVWHRMGSEKALEFFTGYIIEYSLSVDNILVFVLILSYFRVPPEYQHRVLFWGIFGAIVLRGMMIALGVALVERFEWILYIFGAFLLFTGIKILVQKEEHVDLEKNPVLRLCRRFLPVTPDYVGAKFFVRRDGRWFLTPLALVLIFVDFIDLVFAVDSIPAIFAITKDSFIIYTSNICAILGLRSLYFLLGGIIHKFIYLKTGLAIVLAMIGVKMLIVDFWHMPTALSLVLVALILGASVVASMLAIRRKKV